MSATLSRGPPKNAWAPVRYSQTALGGGTTSQGAAFPGGLDLTTPSLRLHSGALRDVLNFEVAQFGGYSRVEGYERYDGRFSPSLASYTIVQITPTSASSGDPGDPGSPGAPAFTLDVSQLDSIDELDGPGPSTPPTPPDPGIPDGNLILPVVGTVVTQAVTGAFGTVIAAVTVPGTPSVSYLVLTLVSGVFDNTHPLTAPGLL